MKRKRLIGLLLVVALLCTAMVVQLVSASEYDFPTVVLPESNPYNNPDYQLKTATVYVNGVESSHTTYDNTYYNDGSVSTIKTLTMNGSSASGTWLKKYDEQGRLKSVQIKSNSNPLLSKYYTFVFNDPNDDYMRIDYENNGAKLVYKTYDPGMDGTLTNQWTFDYDDKGRIATKYKTDEDIWESYTYDEDEQGRIIKKNYRTHYYFSDEDDTGTFDVSYDENGRTETERLDYGSGFVVINKFCYNSNNQITLKSQIVYNNGEDSEPDNVQETEYRYDEHGNMISSDERVVNSYQNSTIHTDYTYEYHPLNIVPAEVPEIQKYWAEYSAQTSLNNGDRINVEMTEPNAGSIKSAAEVLEYDDGTQYYLNEIEESLDASKDQVFSLNFTGEDTDAIDESNPAPAQSIYIYDDNTFSNDHLVASIDNGKMSLTDKTEEDIVEPANAGGAGKLMMALPLQVKATATPGTNVSVNVPAGTLEENKTYYFVLSSDMVVNDKISKSTNTDIVFKFNTGKVEPEHVHKAADPVKENEVAATCTKEGSYDEVIYCSECGEEISRETKKIAKLPHTEEVVKGKAATCTETGLTDGKKCSVCGEVLKAQEEIPALGHDFKDGVCTRCGAKDPDYKPYVNNDLDPSVNGIVQCPDGRWAMYKNGKVDTTCTTIAQNKYGWWRVENGYVNFEANGVYQNKNGWWKTKNGKVTFTEFGLFENENGIWRVEFSKVNFKANSIYKGKDGWYKTTDGKVTGKETGIFQNQFGWWYCKNSKVDFDFTGVASNQYGKWYVKSGKVDFTKVGLVKADGKTVMVMFGKVLFG